MHLSRRQFTAGLTASVAAAASFSTSYAFADEAERLGLNSYSLRSLPHDTAISTVIQAMKDKKLRNCQLWSAHVEPVFGPSFGPPSRLGGVPTPPTPQQLEERKAAAAARSEWRLSVPMSYFEKIRSQFADGGVLIQAYAATFTDSEAELDRLFQGAKALGAKSVNGRVSEALTDPVAAAATKHQLHVGIQVSDVKLLDQQLRTSPVFRADPDAGDLTKAGVEVVQFVQQRAERIDCVDLKDAIAGTGSVAFGEGDAKLRELLRFIATRPSITAYIDCDYPGTGDSVEEVARCVSFVRSGQSLR